MEFNVRIAILQLVDIKQVYEEIPPVLVLSSFIHAPNLLDEKTVLLFLYVEFGLGGCFPYN
jgi:hypothetical protein